MNPDGSQDKNTVSLYETSNGAKLVYESLDALDGTAALKITSHCVGAHVLAGSIIGGTENCVDLNNECSGVVVQCEDYRPSGKYALSAKTCSGVTFRGHISGRARDWEVNLGSWSDQSRSIQAQTRLELTADTYPIRVWIGNAELPWMDDPAKYQLLGFGRHGALVRSLVMLLWGAAKSLRLA